MLNGVTAQGDSSVIAIMLSPKNKEKIKDTVWNLIVSAIEREGVLFIIPVHYELCPALKPTVSRCETVGSAV